MARRSRLCAGFRGTVSAVDRRASSQSVAGRGQCDSAATSDPRPRQAMTNFFAGTHRQPTWRRRARRGLPDRSPEPATSAACPATRADRRKDWAEKTSTALARRFDVIRVEDLGIIGMTRSAKGTVQRPGRNVRAKAGLNRGILRSGWGLLVRRLEDKAPGRVERIHPAFTSQRCSACGRIAAGSRESQALFRCVACGFACNADVNAAINIAAGHAVTARGRSGLPERVNREPQLVFLQHGNGLEFSA